MCENFHRFTPVNLVFCSQILRIPIEEIENIVGCPPTLLDESDFVDASFSSVQTECDNTPYGSPERHVAMQKWRTLAAYRLNNVKTYSEAVLIYDYSPNGSPEKREALCKAMTFLISDSTVG